MQGRGEQWLEKEHPTKNMDGSGSSLLGSPEPSALRQVDAPPSPTLTYLSFLDLPTHIGRDPQKDLLPTQWDTELANLA